jgi:hypothetical protein
VQSVRTGLHEVVDNVDVAEVQRFGSGDDRAGRTGCVPEGMPGDPDP